MAKYRQELVDEIIKLIESDIYTVKEICFMMDISRQTYYEWLDTRPEFKRAVNEALRNRDEMLISIARSSLRKRLEGYTITEERIVYEPCKGNPAMEKEISRVVKKKECPPDLQAIKYVLEKEEKRKEKEESPAMKPTIIEVRDQHTAEQLLIFEKNLRGNLDDIKIRCKETTSPPALSNREGAASREHPSLPPHKGGMASREE